MNNHFDNILKMKKLGNITDLNKEKELRVYNKTFELTVSLQQGWEGESRHSNQVI